MKKLNCWEFMKCGREHPTADRPACPATLATELDGVNGGQAAGRCCWAVVGTICHGEVQGDFAVKKGSCLRCDFFQNVAHEEWPSMIVDDGKRPGDHGR